jgi:hypothetical protein
VDPVTKRRRALRAQADDLADQRNQFGCGRPDGAKRRPVRPKGNAREVLLRKLRRDRPELHNLVLNGELSPFAAAVAAGFRKRPGRQPKRRVDPSDITATQEMELWLGPSHNGSSFTNKEERRRLWLEHRDRLLGYWGQNGRRPQAWWEFDSPIPYPGYDVERSTLYAENLLAEGERAELLKYWRQQFEQRLLDPNVSLDVCERHIESCDIPRPLLAQWANEYLRKKAEPEAETAVQGSDSV